MAKTALEATQSFLKAHPAARPITQRRGRTGRPHPEEPAPRQPDFGRHRCKCRICKHPDRHEIEQEFLRWRSSAEIAQTFGLADHSSVCRHARATGLHDKRRQTVRYALEPILEPAEMVAMKTTVSALTSAVCAYAKINHQGVRPESRQIASTT